MAFASPQQLDVGRAWLAPKPCSRPARFLRVRSYKDERPPYSAGSGRAGAAEAAKEALRSKVASLQNPAKVGGTAVSTAKVKDTGGATSLQEYMNLPTDQYYEIDPSMIIPLGNSRFLLKVPRIQILALWMEPEVEVGVTVLQTSPQRVVLEATRCSLVGSDLVKQLRLDEKFALHFVTELTWGGPSGSNGSGSGSSLSSSSSSDGGEGLAGPGPREAEIQANLELEVWSEVVGVFNLLPRDALVSLVNGILRTLMASLLPLFVRKLGSDYEHWARDPEYRRRRSLAPPRSEAAAVHSQ